MKKLTKSKRLAVEPQDDPGIIDLINKLQQRLSAMEEKLDILISQSSKKPSEQSYSQKPFRRFDSSNRYDRGRGGGYGRDRGRGGGYDRGRGGGYDRGRGGDDGRGERNFTRVICAECNQECEIPFKPSGDRPVYCKECFSKRKHGNTFSQNRDNRPEKRDFPEERRPGKRQTGKRQRPGKKKKPFSKRGKKRA